MNGWAWRPNVDLWKAKGRCGFLFALLKKKSITTGAGLNLIMINAFELRVTNELWVRLNVCYACCLSRECSLPTDAVIQPTSDTGGVTWDPWSWNIPALAFVVLGSAAFLVFLSWKVNCRRWYSIVTTNLDSVLVSLWERPCFVSSSHSPPLRSWNNNRTYIM